MTDETVNLSLVPDWGTESVAPPKTRVIDVHTHLTVIAAAEAAHPLFSPQKDPRARFASAESNTYNEAMRARVAGKFTDPEEKLRDMARMGVSMQVLAIAPFQYYQWADLPLGAELSRLQNDRIAEVVSLYPDSFAGLGTLPLQDLPTAVEELSRVVSELGLPGVMINTSVSGRDLDFPEFEPLWARAEELSILVALHPYGFDAADRMGDYYLTNVLGIPLESTIALSRLILGGVLHRHPGLKLLVVHGGSFLAFYFARTDHAFRHRPELRHHIDRLPSEYLSRVYFDTAVHSSHMVEHLVRHFGAEHVLLGTDYPFDMGVQDPVGLVAGAEGLSEAERELILGGNAARLLGLRL
ncbi:MAG TPA: amidohydrolase family protein [Chromatiaceae bacterium]|nr:amidohydrolase family protein [Chromatiaceae bacterium]